MISTRVSWRTLKLKTTTGPLGTYLMAACHTWRPTDTYHPSLKETIMRVLGVLLALTCATAALADQTPSPAGAEVYIVSPRAGAKVKSPVTVVFGLKGMGIAPAGVKFDNTGH